MNAAISASAPSPPPLPPSLPSPLAALAGGGGADWYAGGAAREGAYALCMGGMGAAEAAAAGGLAMVVGRGAGSGCAPPTISLGRAVGTRFTTTEEFLGSRRFSS
jgi:hypothetical protein